MEVSAPPRRLSHQRPALDYASVFFSSAASVCGGPSQPMRACRCQTGSSCQAPVQASSRCIPAASRSRTACHTAASLRAMEIKADVLLKGTKVEGVYSADPVLVHDAVKYDEITYMEILRQGLKVMDLTAVSLCKDNNLPMIIFNMNQPGNIRRVVMGEKVGSLVTA